MAEKLKQKQVLTQLRELSSEELEQEIAIQRASLYNLRRQNAMKQLQNTAAIRAARRQIARAFTLLRERELAEQREAK
jgi:large subunit ribosomal protein L29